MLRIDRQCIFVHGNGKRKKRIPDVEIIWVPRMRQARRDKTKTHSKHTQTESMLHDISSVEKSEKKTLFQSTGKLSKFKKQTIEPSKGKERPCKFMQVPTRVHAVKCSYLNYIYIIKILKLNLIVILFLVRVKKTRGSCAFDTWNARVLYLSFFFAIDLFTFSFFKKTSWASILT